MSSLYEQEMAALDVLQALSLGWAVSTPPQHSRKRGSRKCMRQSTKARSSVGGAPAMVL